MGCSGLVYGKVIISQILSKSYLASHHLNASQQNFKTKFFPPNDPECILLFRIRNQYKILERTVSAMWYGMTSHLTDVVDTDKNIIRDLMVFFGSANWANLLEFAHCIGKIQQVPSTFINNTQPANGSGENKPQDFSLYQDQYFAVYSQPRPCWDGERNK